jgi:broad specificity phosphatase PhoE
LNYYLRLDGFFCFRGNFQDLATREITVTERQKIGRFFYRFRNGESGADVYDRVSSFMESLYREMDNGLMRNNNVFIVSHGLFMRLFLTRFYRWSVEQFHTLENFDNCSYCILERDDQDGSYILKTELKTFSKNPTIKTDAKETFNDKSFNIEVHPIIHTEDIGQTGKKND